MKARFKIGIHIFNWNPNWDIGTEPAQKYLGVNTDNITVSILTITIGIDFVLSVGK